MSMVRRDDLGIRTTGILWALNEFVLWPLGLALTIEVERPGDDVSLAGAPVYLTEWSHAAGHLETIADATEYTIADLANEPEGRTPAERFMAFLVGRLADMPDAERQLAVDRLRRILPEVAE